MIHGSSIESRARLEASESERRQLSRHENISPQPLKWVRPVRAAARMSFSTSSEVRYSRLRTARFGSLLGGSFLTSRETDARVTWSANT